MKADPASCITNIPFLINSMEEMPEWLSNTVNAMQDGALSHWLVLPYEGVGDEPYQEMAIRAVEEDLEIVTAVPVNGNAFHELKAENCAGVKFENRLLLHRVTFFERGGGSFGFQYNGAGENAVRELLSSFLHGMESRAVGPEKVTGESPDVEHRTDFARRFTGWFADGESYVAAIQQSTVYHTVKRWFTRGLAAVPASAVAVSDKKVVVASASFEGKPEKFGETVSVLPLDCVVSFEVLQADGETVGLRVTSADGQQEAAVFSAMVYPSLLLQVESVCAAYLAVADSQKARVHVLTPGVSAQLELVRLTGVDLPEPEALEALVQIHKYKWLEAERAGFDTWAVIQPENPLRAAAVHWVRKYFGQFEEAMHRGAA